MRYQLNKTYSFVTFRINSNMYLCIEIQRPIAGMSGFFRITWK